MTTEVTTIPLNKLFPWEGNVRKTHSAKRVKEMASSITTHGLLQGLVVRKDRRGRFAVIAGRRRYLALHSLAEAGSIAKNLAVPCTILPEDTNATEISLVENVERESMHPADEFEAFYELVESGMPVTDVAARFGVTKTVVQQRLKLAKVSPALLAAYRKGQITLEHVMAFTVTDDHARQEQVWAELPERRKNDPAAIRDLLIETEVTASDRRVRFVTLKAYEKAGGATRRDLFSDGEDGVFIDDLVLLERLTAAKLEAIATAVRAEGWAWVEIRETFDYSEKSEFARRFSEYAPLPPDQQEELDLLTDEVEALAQVDEPDEEQKARFDIISDRIGQLNERELAWPEETLAIAGAVITLDQEGEPDVDRGYVRPQDLPQKARKGDSDETKPEKTGISATLMESLTAHRSAALNATLLDRPEVALAATVHALALQVFYHGHAGEIVLQVNATASSLDRVEGSSAGQSIEAAADHWRRVTPPEPESLLTWCLDQPADRLLRLLAFCLAQTVNAVLLKADRPDSPRTKHAERLAQVLNLDMAAWFMPTAANYFGKLNKAGIVEALREIKGDVSPAWSGMKKAELAALAEKEVSGTGWLPDPLRASTSNAAD